MGYCDESAGIGCWMDTDSVKDVLRDAPGIAEEVLDEVDLDYIDKVEDMYSTESKPIFTKADELVKEISELKDLNEEVIDAQIKPVVDKLIDVGERGYLNDIKAKALFLIGKIYHEVTRKIFEKGVVVEGEGGSEGEEDDKYIIGTKLVDGNNVIWEKVKKNLWKSEEGERVFDELRTPLVSYPIIEVDGDKIIIYDKQALSDDEIEDYLRQWDSSNDDKFEIIDTKNKIIYFNEGSDQMIYEVREDSSNTIIEIIQSF